jgi:hypothetical protein
MDAALQRIFAKNCLFDALDAGKPRSDRAPRQTLRKLGPKIVTSHL